MSVIAVFCLDEARTADEKCKLKYGKTEIEIGTRVMRKLANSIECAQIMGR